MVHHSDAGAQTQQEGGQLLCRLQEAKLCSETEKACTAEEIMPRLAGSKVFHVSGRRNRVIPLHEDSMRLTTFITPFFKVGPLPPPIWSIEHSRKFPKGYGRDFDRSWEGRGRYGWYTHTLRNRGNTWPWPCWGNKGHWRDGPWNWTK